MDAAAVANGRGASEEESGGHEKVSFTGLFRYADGADVLLMLVGTVASLANGVSQPLMTLFFGDALDAFGGATDGDVLQRVNKYCCHGQHANPVTCHCQPTFYSKKFKEVCPAAYSYAYDDPSSIFTCAQSPDYTIIFCSNRKQFVCSYHNERLVCSGSSSSTSALTLLTLLLASLMALQLAPPVGLI